MKINIFFTLSLIFSYTSKRCSLIRGPYRYPFKVVMNQGSSIEKGQCTEWADGRMYQLLGRHTLFNGDAKDWPKLLYGKWKLSRYPVKVPSLMILQPGINGAGEYGHVAVVEDWNRGDRKVCTSNWNFDTLGETTLINFPIVSGVSFIYYDN